MRDGKLSGSRNDDGNVPNVNWNDGQMRVNWYNPDNANGNLRAREAVSTRIIPGKSGDYRLKTSDTLSSRLSFWRWSGALTLIECIF